MKDIVLATVDEHLFVYQNSASAHPLSHGVRIDSASAPGASYIATDRASGLIFASCSRRVLKPGDAYSVTVYCVMCWQWDGHTLRSRGPIAALGQSFNSRPLTVIPASTGPASSPGGSASIYGSVLVAGYFGSPDIVALSLPSCEVVFTGALKSIGGHGNSAGDYMAIIGLAADGVGRTLAVANSNANAVELLPWPLSAELLDDSIQQVEPLLAEVPKPVVVCDRIPRVKEAARNRRDKCSVS